MPNPQAPTTGTTMVRISSEDPCGNYTSGEREVTVVQNLIAGRYISIVEDGNTAEISADPSEGYYNKNEINEILADLDTVQFRIVAALPAIGAGNVIYLVRQEAPLTGYLQYIWNTDDRAYHAIGDTDIDLADYYTKIQADEKFQEKLTYSDPLLRVTDSTEISQTNLTTKKVKQMTAFNIWEYFKTKIVPEPQATVTDSTQFSEVNGNNTDVVKNTSGLAIWNYIKGKFDGSMESPVTDGTRISGIDTSKTNIHSYFSASDLWDYVKGKFTKDAITTVTDTTKLGSIDTAKTNVVQETTAKALFDYMWKKIYPVGSVYTTITTDNPATLFGGTWVHFGTDRVLWGVAENTAAGSTLAQQLPDIRGYLDWTGGSQAKTELSSGSGAISMSNKVYGAYPTGTGNSYSNRGFTFRASDYDSTYKSGGVVRPSAYTVHFWRRTA